MNKTLFICFLLLCCGVCRFEEGMANAKSSIENNRGASIEERRRQIEYYRFEEKKRKKLEERKLIELREKAKILFPDIIEYDQISAKYFEQDRDIFTMKFSNVIYESDGKIVRVPIFRGTMGDVLYKDFVKYTVTKKLIGDELSRLSEYIRLDFKIKFNKGEFYKVFEEFKRFYGRYLSIDFKNKPSSLRMASDEQVFYGYTFSLDGVSGELLFYYPIDEYINQVTEFVYFFEI